jgi:hypothetical protein
MCICERGLEKVPHRLCEARVRKERWRGRDSLSSQWLQKRVVLVTFLHGEWSVQAGDHPTHGNQNTRGSAVTLGFPLMLQGG